LLFFHRHILESFYSRICRALVAATNTLQWHPRVLDFERRCSVG